MKFNAHTHVFNVDLKETTTTTNQEKTVDQLKLSPIQP